MDYGKILSRAFEITLKQRALWLFGILFALAGGNRSGGSFSVPNGGASGRGTDVTPPTIPDVSASNQETILAIIIAVFCIVVLWSVAMLLLRFVSRGALIGLVNELETTLAAPTVGRGFSIGWERFRSLFGVGLIVNLPIVLVSFVLLLIALAPILASVIPLIASNRLREATPVLIAGIAGSVLMLCIVGACLWVVHLLVRPFYEFFVRACVIGKHGAMDSLRQGYRIVRANLKQVAVLYILVIAVGFGFSILMLPIAAILIGIAVAVGFAAYAVTSTVLTGVIAGSVIGLFVFLVLLIFAGLYEVFESSVWTQGYLAATATPTPVAPLASPPSTSEA